MKRYKVFDIFWETNGHDLELLNLPPIVGIKLEDGQDTDELGPAITDIYGWEINSLDYEEV